MSEPKVMWHRLAPRLRGWLRDPLLHFIVLGTALYVLIPQEDDLASDRIEVSRADLLGFMQARARFYDDSRFAEAYEALPGSERALLARVFFRQEALYREALKSGLDKADPLIRSRMVQQMELLLRDEAASDTSISDAEVDAYFAAHARNYSQPPMVSFTHVFIDGRKHGAESAAIARSTLNRLRNGRVSPEDAIEFGDRFPYQRNYSSSTSEALTPEIGEAATNAAFTISVGQWQGPYQSGLGFHLLYVTRRIPQQTPELEAIRTQVAQDALQAKRERLGEEAVQRVLSAYRFVPSADAGLTPASGSKRQ